MTMLATEISPSDCLDTDLAGIHRGSNDRTTSSFSSITSLPSHQLTPRQPTVRSPRISHWTGSATTGSTTRTSSAVHRLRETHPAPPFPGETSCDAVTRERTELGRARSGPRDEPYNSPMTSRTTRVGAGQPRSALWPRSAKSQFTHSRPPARHSRRHPDGRGHWFNPSTAHQFRLPLAGQSACQSPR